MTRNLLICLPMFLVYTCFIVVLVNGQQQSVYIPPSYKEVFIDQEIQLPCSSRNVRDSCRWKKDGKPVMLQPGKYEWMTNRDGDCTLLIKKASLDLDDGYWICQISSTKFKPDNSFKAFSSQLLVIGEFPIRKC